MKKIGRNMSTPESRAFWANSEANSAEVATWPAWKRAGVNVSQLRNEPREEPVIGERRLINMEDLNLILSYVHARGLTTDGHSDQLRRFAHAEEGARMAMRLEMRKTILVRW